MGTFGYLMPFCLVEDEESLKKIGWKPYHSSIGFNENESTVKAQSAKLKENESVIDKCLAKEEQLDQAL